jgi:hypothetical protein
MDIRTELPGGIASGEEEVIERILKCDFARESDGVRAFKNKYIEYGGDATKKCVEALLGK